MATDKNIVKAAKLYYVAHYKDPEEIAVLLDVSPRTIRSWATKGKWKVERDARINSKSQHVENIHRLTAHIAERSLLLHDERIDAVCIQDKAAIAKIDAELVSLSDQAAKWNKLLERLDKSGRITLEIYLEVMDSVFQNMQLYNNELYLKTIDFQAAHVEHISSKLG